MKADQSGGLTNEALQYSQIIASSTGLDLGVVEAWVAHESAYGASPAGQFNFLNLRGSSGSFASYGSVQQAAQAVIGQLQKAPEWYGGILGSTGQSPAQQIAAIAASPWDAGHYGGKGGVNLVNTYNSMKGLKLQPVPDETPAPQHPVVQAAQTLAQALKLSPETAQTLASVAQDMVAQAPQAPDASQNELADQTGGKFDAPVQSLTNLMEGWQPEDPGSSTEPEQPKQAVASGG